MYCSGEVIRQLHAYVLIFFFLESLNTNHFYLNGMQTNYVMEYLNDYNENAKIIKFKFVFEVYV